MREYNLYLCIKSNNKKQNKMSSPTKKANVQPFKSHMCVRNFIKLKTTSEKNKKKFFYVILIYIF